MTKAQIYKIIQLATTFILGVAATLLTTSCNTTLSIGKNQSSSNAVGIVSDSVAVTAVDSFLHVVKDMSDK